MKSDLLSSDPGFGADDRGVNSGAGTEVEEDHQPTTVEEGLGLLRMEEKLWLLESVIDLDNDETVRLKGFLGFAIGDSELPGDREDGESIAVNIFDI